MCAAMQASLRSAGWKAQGIQKRCLCLKPQGYVWNKGSAWAGRCRSLFLENWGTHETDPVCCRCGFLLPQIYWPLFIGTGDTGFGRRLPGSACAGKPLWIYRRILPQAQWLWYGDVYKAKLRKNEWSPAAENFKNLWKWCCKNPCPGRAGFASGTGCILPGKDANGVCGDFRHGSYAGAKETTSGRRRKKSYGKDRRYPVCYGRFIHKDRKRGVSSKRSAQPVAQGGIGRTAKRDAETLPETGSSAEEGREKISGGMWETGKTKGTCFCSDRGAQTACTGSGKFLCDFCLSGHGSLWPKHNDGRIKRRCKCCYAKG